ncbi:helix-turn-helix transcriptional regulator [Granulicella paludicola]|uniref:helix-turn-helix transcriptional regulator n=1 Tax=Granulicella paludicola TaxID=474951 RepID=UPI0021DF44C6|nr:YafY family protein [Granulicella paludicola]
MRRADRLFRIVQMLRSGRLKTARALAERLQVSERTIYRDVRDLQLAGQPIEGEAGVGYTLRREFDLPPLMFTPQELTALVLGARLVKAWGGAESVVAASSALARIEAVLPAELAAKLDAIALYAPDFVMTAAQRKLLDQLHAACLDRIVTEFRYTKLGEDESQAKNRRVRPLALTFWSGVWTLAAWCELRDDFRIFRIDRIAEFRLTGENFTQKRGQRLEDLSKLMRAKAKAGDTTQSLRLQGLG